MGSPPLATSSRRSRPRCSGWRWPPGSTSRSRNDFGVVTCKGLSRALSTLKFGDSNRVLRIRGSKRVVLPVPPPHHPSGDLRQILRGSDLGARAAQSPVPCHGVQGMRSCACAAPLPVGRAGASGWALQAGLFRRGSRICTDTAHLAGEVCLLWARTT